MWSINYFCYLHIVNYKYKQIIHCQPDYLVRVVPATYWKISLFPTSIPLLNVNKNVTRQCSWNPLPRGLISSCSACKWRRKCVCCYRDIPNNIGPLTVTGGRRGWRCILMTFYASGGLKKLACRYTLILRYMTPFHKKCVRWCNRHMAC